MPTLEIVGEYVSLQRHIQAEIITRLEIIVVRRNVSFLLVYVIEKLIRASVEEFFKFARATFFITASGI